MLLWGPAVDTNVMDNGDSENAVNDLVHNAFGGQLGSSYARGHVQELLPSFVGIGGDKV